MESSIALLRLLGLMFVLSGLMFGLYLRHVGHAGALTAVSAAASAATAELGPDWDCGLGGLADAERAAASAIVHRLGTRGPVTPTAVTVAANPDCVLAVSVTTSIHGWWSAVYEHDAVACVPSVASGGLGWSDPQPC